MEKLATVILTRIFNDDKQALGSFVVYGTELFLCKSLERPWKDNKPSISCIPAGNYICKWTKSPRFSRESLARWLKKNLGKKVSDAPDEVKSVYTYEVMNVPNRAGIRIHSANYFFQIEGCIALGDAHKDINADGNLDVIHSGNTLDKFNKLMNKKDFVLTIIDNFQQVA